jgi:hypothetical protein
MSESVIFGQGSWPGFGPYGGYAEYITMRNTASSRGADEHATSVSLTGGRQNLRFCDQCADVFRSKVQS